MNDAEALLSTRDGRPAVLAHHGGTIYIAVHDEFYRRRKADFKNRLKLAHPDMTPVLTVTTKTYDVRAYACNSKFGRTYQRPAFTRNRGVRKQRNRGREFRKIATAYEKWQAEEVVWYAAYGLTPPEWGS